MSVTSGAGSMAIAIKRGLPLEVAGAPAQSVGTANDIRSAGILGTDYPDIRLKPLVAVGDSVARGAALACDQKRPDILVCAPAAGVVSEIGIGEKRRLATIAIAIGGKNSHRFSVPTALNRERLQVLLLKCGLWPCLTARPFGRIPDPGLSPGAIFVTAIDSRPHAVDAKVVLAGKPDLFCRGVRALTVLTDGPVFVCQAPGDSLAREHGQIRCVRFAGSHPAGLAGTHIDRLFPLHGMRSVWQIHYQDVIAIGSLIETGEPETDRVISLAGPGVRSPRLVQIPAGSALDELMAGELHEGGPNFYSGSVLGGMAGRFLSRHHWQVTANFLGRTARRTHSLPNLAPMRPAPVIPTEALMRSLGPNIHVVPLVRALSVGDVEAAARLGCLRLLEEDMELVTYATSGEQDFSILLRLSLDILEREM
ncbi:MAG: NADH:ubiquinone reductase (Na(+)-transporting) subunit A [Alphaproteobacteria bacterium]